MNIDIKVVYLIFAGVVTFAITAAFLFVIPVLVALRKNLDSTNEVIKTVEDGLKPTLRHLTDSMDAVSQMTGSVARKVEAAGKTMRFLSLINSVADLVKDGSERVSKATIPGRNRLLGILTGLKKGYDIFTRSKKL